MEQLLTVKDLTPEELEILRVLRMLEGSRAFWAWLLEPFDQNDDDGVQWAQPQMP